MIFEERFIYFPARYPDGDYDAPTRTGADFEDVWIATPDGVRLHAWYVPHPDAKWTLLYLHGNAGNISYRVDWILRLREIPANVLALDYRGYGRSEGKPSESGIEKDAEAAYRWLTEERGLDPGSIVVYGKSLGGAPACALASRRPCGVLILQSTFTSVPAMASRMAPFVPAMLVRTRMDNLRRIRDVRVPLLILHSRDDEIVPFEMAQALFDAAPEPKRLYAFEGAGHNDFMLAPFADSIIAAMRDFLSTARP